MKLNASLLLALSMFVGCDSSTPADAPLAPGFITLGSTTSTRDSGLLADLTARFHARTGIEVHVIAAGTGRALEYGRRGDVDLLLVHHRPSEDTFVAEGYAPYRRDLMFNDFLLVGPAGDPAKIGGTGDVKRALASIAAASATFVSRGDDSGTHKKERALWSDAGIDPSPHSGTWYRETGSGMGATLNIAAEMGAYTLTDRGTWLSSANRQTLEIVVEGDPPLHNPYGLLPIDPDKHPHVKFEAAERFIEWLLSEEGLDAIDAFRVGGEPLFFAHRSHSEEAAPLSD